MLPAVSTNALINFMAVANNSTVPALFNIPTRNRNLTGSPNRSRRVDKASDTDLCPFDGDSHAFVNS